MQLTFLGTGNAFAPQRFWGCIVVNDRILLDASPCVLANLKQHAIDPAGIQHIFISHFHGDHFFGLPFLMLEYQFLVRTESPLFLIGPPGIEAITRQTMDLAYPGLFGKAWPRPVTFLEATPGVEMTAGDLCFTAVEMRHGDSLMALGYRMQFSDGVLAYSGDTQMTDALITLIDGARVIILEASAQDESPVHLGRQALQTILAHVPVDAQVLLTHLDTPDAKAWQDFPVLVPVDGQQYTFPAPLAPVHEIAHG